MKIKLLKNQSYLNNKNDEYKFLLKYKFHKMDFYEQYNFFKDLEIPINYAINKVIKKFYYLPIEKEDFISIAWIGFNDAINKYVEYNGNKTFISFVIDSVSWKCFDYASSFVNNKHKILNLNSKNFQWIEYNDNTLVTETSIDVFEKINIKLFLEDYFQKNKIISFYKSIFLEYICLVPIIKISKKYNISRVKVTKIIKKIINDLSNMVK